MQNELALLGAIRLLVALLAHDLIDDKALKVTNNKSPSFHSIVQSLGEQRVQGDGACDSGHASTQDLTGQTGNHLDTDLEPAPVGLEPGSVVTHGRRSTTYCQSTRQTSALHQGNQNPQDKLEDPEIKLMLKAEVAHALWKLAANNVNNSKLITDTCALLCFSKLIETGQRTVKYNSIMAIMEITAAAEKDGKLRRTAFRANSAAVKAVVECLLQVLEADTDEPNLQVCFSQEYFSTLILVNIEPSTFTIRYHSRGNLGQVFFITIGIVDLLISDSLQLQELRSFSLNKQCRFRLPYCLGVVLPSKWGLLSPQSRPETFASTSNWFLN